MSFKSILNLFFHFFCLSKETNNFYIFYNHVLQLNYQCYKL